MTTPAITKPREGDAAVNRDAPRDADERSTSTVEAPSEAPYGLQRVRARLGLATAGLIAFGATQLVAAMTARSALASTLLQAVTAELSAGKLGVTWADEREPAMTTKRAAKRAARGALASVVAVGGGLVLARLAGQATITTATPSASMLVVGIVGPLCLAARDELLLRGFVFAVLDGLAPRLATTAVAALASIAVASAAPGATLADLAAAGLIGLLCASLWARERGIWSALGCHAAYGYLTSVLLRGGLLDVRMAPSFVARFGLGSALETSMPGLVALAAVAFAALAWSRRGARAPHASGGAVAS